MSNLIASLAWCWLQVLLVAATATVLTLLALRRSPTAGATIASSGIIASLALTVLVIAPFPTQLGYRKIHELLTSQSHVQPGIVKPKQEPQAPSESSDEPNFPPASIGPLLDTLFKSIRNSESAVVRHQGQSQWLLLVVVIGVTIGLLRLAISLWAIATLRRRSAVVSDHRAVDLVAELLPCLPIRRPPQLRQTNDLNSAAVVGWWRPVVMLPADWRQWSHDELKAVLAHELAHIARHDAPWRLVAAFMVALHWGQPLMHWLRGQLLLAQELAADELAAAAVGSKREYLRSLAKLALLQDSRPAVTQQAAFLPVFSGFLLRRIDMLRAMDGSTRRDWRRLTQGTATALVLVVAILAAAMRGLAEPPETEPDGSIRVAKATDVKAKPAIAANGTANEEGFFQRPPIDITKFALASRGGLLVRLGEICQQPRFAESVRKSDQMFIAFWKTTYPGAEAPPCSLKDIDYIVGDFLLAGRYVTRPYGETKPLPHHFTAGCSYAFIRWQKPVDEVVAWLKRTPGAEEKQHGEVSYVELPKWGAEKMCVCPVDSHTLLWAGETSFLKPLDKFVAATEPPAWHSAWKEVAGGLFTAVAAETQYKVPEETDQAEADRLNRSEEDRLNREFFVKTRLLAIGVDWQPQERGNTTYKIHARFENEADARSIEAATRRALEMSIQQAREDASKATEETKKLFFNMVIALLQDAQIETRQTENGWQIDVHLRGPFDIESNL